MIGHMCTTCAQRADTHPEACGVANDCYHYPALCCPGCDCRAFEEAHPMPVAVHPCGCLATNPVERTEGRFTCTRCHRGWDVDPCEPDEHVNVDVTGVEVVRSAPMVQCTRCGRIGWRMRA